MQCTKRIGDFRWFHFFDVTSASVKVIRNLREREAVANILVHCLIQAVGVGFNEVDLKGWLVVEDRILLIDRRHGKVALVIECAKWTPVTWKVVLTLDSNTLISVWH
jgi:hypothetical protein